MADYSYKIKMQQFAPWLVLFQQEAIDAIHKGVLAGAERGVDIIQRSQKNFGAVDTGNMLRSWQAEAIDTGAHIISTAPYSSVVEYGRRPGARFPPPAVIERWAMRKLKLSPMEAARAAYPIARKIAMKGIKARPIVGSVMDQIEDAVDEEIEAQLEELAV